MRQGTGKGTVAALALTCVFGATMLLSLATGAGIYRSVTGRVETASERRVGLSYITAKVHSFDEAGGVHVGYFWGQDALYLLQDYDGVTYETILYVYDGHLMELFCQAGWEQEPEAGQAITEAGELRVKQVADDLLRLTYTAAGRTESADLYLRSN